MYVDGVDTSVGNVTLCKKGEKKMKYSLLQDGDDWSVLVWDTLNENWTQMVTFHSDTWGILTREAAEEYIRSRKIINAMRSMMFLSEVGNG